MTSSCLNNTLYWGRVVESSTIQIYKFVAKIFFRKSKTVPFLPQEWNSQLGHVRYGNRNESSLFSSSYSLRVDFYTLPTLEISCVNGNVKLFAAMLGAQPRGQSRMLVVPSCGHSWLRSYQWRLPADNLVPVMSSTSCNPSGAGISVASISGEYQAAAPVCQMFQTLYVHGIKNCWPLIKTLWSYV